MPCNIIPDGSHTKKLYSRLSSSEMRLYMENGHFAILSHSPPFKTGVGATYDVHLTLIGERVGDFLLALIELTRCYGSGATSEYRLKIGVFAPRQTDGWTDGQLYRD